MRSFLHPIIVGLAMTAVSFEVHASCLDEAAAFAKSICGEISNKGDSNSVSAELSAKVDNFLTRIGGVSGGAKFDAAKSSYDNVIRDELEKEHTNYRECAQNMANVGITQVCNKQRVIKKICWGEGGGNNCQSGAYANLGCGTYHNVGANILQYMKDTYCPNQPSIVEQIQNNGGGGCGWTGFNVTCNP